MFLYHYYKKEYNEYFRNKTINFLPFPIRFLFIWLCKKLIPIGIVENWLKKIPTELVSFICLDWTFFSQIFRHICNGKKIMWQLSLLTRSAIPSASVSDKTKLQTLKVNVGIRDILIAIRCNLRKYPENYDI